MLADQFETFLTANSECNISLGQFVLKLAELVLTGELDKPFISHRRQFSDHLARKFKKLLLFCNYLFTGLEFREVVRKLVFFPPMKCLDFRSRSD